MEKYGLIGEKLGHSYSKIIHEQLTDYTYDLIPLTKEEFQEKINSYKNKLNALFADGQVVEKNIREVSQGDENGRGLSLSFYGRRKG